MMPLRSAIADLPRRARTFERAAKTWTATLREGRATAMGSLPSAAVLTRAVAAGMIAVAVAASPATAGGAAARHQKPAAPDLAPDGTVPDRVVKSGEQTGVASVWDCGLPNFAPVVSARVEHGTVAVVTGNGPNCGYPKMSLTTVLYRPNPGFRGKDTLTVLAFVTSGDINRTFTILVK